MLYVNYCDRFYINTTPVGVSNDSVITEEAVSNKETAFDETSSSENSDINVTIKDENL